MRSKRIMSMVVCAALVTTAFTGCGGPKKNNEPSDTNGKQASGEFFPLQKQITVKIAGVRGDSVAPFADVAMFKELEKKTNVKVEWIDWPQSVQKEKRNLAFSSGDLPDALYGGWSLDKPDVVKYGGDGMLLDFTKYLNDKYMPNFSRILAAEQGLKNSLSVPEGQVYVLPTLDKNTLTNTNDTLVINTDWLNKVGKKKPTTIDELVDVLKAFKAAGDLNGNGKNDEIPMSFLYPMGNNDANNSAYGLMGFTGIPAQNKNSRMVMKAGKPAFFPALDEYKEYLKFLNKLHSEGLLDKEVFTMNTPAYNAKTQTKTPMVGVFSTWSAENINKSLPDFDTTKDGIYQYLAPLKGSSGAEPKWGLRVNALNANLSFAVSAKTKYPEEIVRWIDLAYAKENSINNLLGVVGKHIKSEGGNKYSNILKPDGKKFTDDEMSVDIPKKFAVAYVLEGDAEFIDKVASAQNKDAAAKIYGPYIEKDYVNDYVMSTVEEGNRMALLSTDLFAQVDQMTAKFVTSGGIDAGWDAYIKQLKTLGLDEYVKIKTDIHNRASKK